MSTLEFYILCKYLTEAAKKQQPLDEYIKRIIEAVDSYKLDIHENENE